MKITDKQIEFIIERLKEDKQETELGYFGRERDNIHRNHGRPSAGG